MIAPPTTGVEIVALLLERVGSNTLLLTLGESTTVEPGRTDTRLAVIVRVAVPPLGIVPSEHTALPRVVAH
jgi:hypothetical protein